MTPVKLTEICLTAAAVILTAGVAGATSFPSPPALSTPSLSRDYVPYQSLRPMTESALRVDGDTDAVAANTPVQAVAASDQIVKWRK